MIGITGRWRSAISVRSTRRMQLPLTAIAASPIAFLDTWRSPVLIIQGNDDHNVAFSESVRLARGLRDRGIDYSELIFPDEIHGILRHESWLRAYHATAKFLETHLQAGE